MVIDDPFINIPDQDLIDEIYDRGLEDRFDDYINSDDILLEDATDEQILDECRMRNIIFADEDGMEELYYLMAQGLPYEEKLKEIIYNTVGHIL